VAEFADCGEHQQRCQEQRHDSGCHEHANLLGWPAVPPRNANLNVCTISG
jgi:hypothetical protein